jgi:general stress protein YciG
MIQQKTSRRGLASADEQTRKRVDRKGDQTSRGGFARLDEPKQKEIARLGGKVSRGDGRPAS